MDETHEKKEHVHHKHEHKEHAQSVNINIGGDKIKIPKIQVWQIATGVLTALLIISIFTHGFSSGGSAGALPAQEAATKAVSFLNANVLQGATATLTSVEEIGDLYNLKLSIAGRDYDSYVTKDGSLLFPSGVSLEEAPAAPAAPAQQPAQDYPKTAKPKVDLFIMSYCPYGLQAQQGLYPVMKLFGDKIEANVKWVPYIMHGLKEIDENNRQYCIQKTQKSKYVDYVECFVASKDAASCGETAGIDEAKIDACAEAADKEFSITKNFDDKASWMSGRYPIYEVDKVEADSLGVRGSPSMFVNGMQYSGARTPEAYKAAICNAFESVPEECGEALSSEGAAATGSCD